MTGRTLHIVAWLFFCVCMCQSFTPPPPQSALAMHLTSDLKYKSDTTLGETTKIETPLPVRKTKPSKPMVEEIFSLDELKWFLEEDERPVVIKFYAKWCKKCQKLGLQFNRLALDMGDHILDQQMIYGDVRFAAVEYNPQSQAFITEDLQIKGVPDMQVYVGTHKLLEAGSSIKKIRTELGLLEGMRHEDVLKRAAEADDGVLTTLIEDSFFDSPSFLNEEW